jgi:Peptidase M15
MTLIAPNFDSSEFDISGTVPAQYAANVQALADLLQQFRTMTGSAIEITSCYRDPAHNAAVGGVGNSQHLTASAADVEFLDLPMVQVAQMLQAAEAAGAAPGPYSQCIFYTTDDHVHIGIYDPTLSVGQDLVYYSATNYQTLNSTNIQDLGDEPPSSLVQSDDTGTTVSPTGVGAGIILGGFLLWLLVSYGF